MAFGKKKEEAATVKPVEQPQTPQNQQALAKQEPPPEHQSLAVVDFSDYTDEEKASLAGTSGFESLPENRRRMPLVTWNMDFRDEWGNDVRPDRFYNCQTGETTEEINCAMLYIKPTNERSYRDQATGHKTVFCRSFDGVTGETIPSADGESSKILACQNCVHKQSKTPGQKKACTTIDRIVAWDLDAKDFFTFMVKSSNYIPMTRYLEKNFLGKIKVDNRRIDIPLYMIHTNITLKEETNPAMKSRYYVIVPSSRGPLPKSVVMDLQPMAEAAKKMSRSDIVQDEPKQKEEQKHPNQPGNENPPVDDDDVPF